MKFRFSQYALLLAASLGVASCGNDDGDYIAIQSAADDGDLVAMTFGVEMEGQAKLSKASLGINASNQTTFAFTQNDSMSVFGAGQNKYFSYIGRIDGFATFKGDVKVDNTFYALFPYQSGATIQGNVIKTQIPEVQNLVAGDYSSHIISVGAVKGVGNKFTLKNACALIWLDVDFSDKPFKSVKIKSNQQIAGTVTIHVNSDGVPEIYGGGSQTITANYPESGLIAVVPHDAADLTVTFERMDGSSFSREYKDVSLKRSEIAYLSVADGHFANFNTMVSGKTMPSISVHDNAVLELPEIGDITNSNLHFLGWKSNGKVYAPHDKISLDGKDWDFVAQWGDDIMVSFNVPFSDKQIVKYVKVGESVVMPEAEKVEGYVFSSWLGPNGVPYKEGASFTPSTASLVVTAAYDPIRYTITCNADGGLFNNGQDNKIGYCNYGNSLNLVSEFNYPTKKGFAFGGYYLADDKYFDNKITEIVNPTSDVDLQVRWYKEYTIKYLYSDGTPVLNSFDEPMVTVFTDLSYLIEIENPEIDGLVSEGYAWKDQNGKEWEKGDKILPSVLDKLEDMEMVLQEF